jgi:hypothetical protein
MSKPMETTDTWPEGAALDRAMDAAFYDAVRRHRAANVPLVMWVDGESKHVSPFEIPLPGEDLPRAPELRVSDSPKRRVQGGD